MRSRLIIGLVLLILLGYGLFEAIPLALGPTITLSSPADGQTFDTDAVLIQGVAKHTETLMLNGGILLIDEKGHFSTSLTLPSGNAILTLTATDRFGRSRTLTRTVRVP